MMRMFPVRTMEAMMNIVAIWNSVLVVAMLCLIQSFPAFPVPSRIISGRSCLLTRLLPLPVTDFRHVFAVLVDVMLVLDELVLNHLLQVGPFSAQLRYSINHVLHQVEPVQGVLHPHIKRRRDGALLLVAPDV